MTMITIRNEIHRDVAAREALLDRSFGDARFQKAAERLREGRLPAHGLSFVASDRGRVVGTVRLWHVSAGPSRPALLLGPLAVHPDDRCRGLGGALMRAFAATRPSGSATAPCCWSATRRTTAASASRPRRPAACGCPAATTRNRLLARELAARRARRRARPRQRDRAAGSPSRRSPRWSHASTATANPHARPDPSCLGVPDMNALTRMTDNHLLHAQFAGPIVMIGFGSIGRGVLPLLERHIGFDRSKFVVIDPVDTDRALLDERKLRFEQVAITRENYREVLTPLLTGGPGRGMIINLSVDTSSADLMDFCKDIDAFYIDTVCEPWPGLYTDAKASISQRSNYALREGVLDVRRRRPGGVTAVSCCGANPGMVSWMVKQALLDVATRHRLDVRRAEDPRGLGAADAARRRQGHPHRRARHPARARRRSRAACSSTPGRSRASAPKACSPPSSAGARTRSTCRPNGHRHDFGCDAAIYLTRPGAGTRVRSWTPTAQAQHGFLVTHNESISIADYFTLREGGKVVYRPTCHYAYHPCDDAVLSLHEMAGAAWKRQPKWKILDEHEIVDGIDELGVLLYGHAKNAYWYGSQLSIEETRQLAPYQNATGLQVTSAVLAGIVWMLENPDRGIVEADEMDFRRCLEIQRPYLGPVIGHYTDWTPLTDRGGLFPEDIDTSDPWQFKNVLVV